MAIITGLPLTPINSIILTKSSSITIAATLSPEHQQQHQQQRTQITKNTTPKATKNTKNTTPKATKNSTPKGTKIPLNQISTCHCKCTRAIFSFE
jgi:hemolysin activation/secretion protein